MAKTWATTQSGTGLWNRDAQYNDSCWYGSQSSGIPEDGDTVTISATHTVTFNVDQGAWAGLANLTINGILQASTTAGVWRLKVAGSIGGTGTLRAGTDNTTRYPSTCVFKIILAGTTSRILCTSGLTCQFWCYNPVVHYVQLTSATSKAIGDSGNTITTGTTTTVYCTGHGFAAGDTVWLLNVGGIPNLSNLLWKTKTVSTNSFTLRWWDSDAEVDSTGWGTYTSGGTVCPSQAEAIAQTQLEVDTNISADPEWCRTIAVSGEGAEFVIGTNSRTGSGMVLHAISEATPPTSTAITISAGLAAVKSSGTAVMLATRNIRIDCSAVTSTTIGAVHGGTGHQLDCSIKGANSTGGYAVVSATFTMNCGSFYLCNRGVDTCTVSMTGGFIGYMLGYNTCVSFCYLTMSGGTIGLCSNGISSSNLSISGGRITQCTSALTGCVGAITGGLLDNDNQAMNACRGVSLTNCRAVNNAYVSMYSVGIITGTGFIGSGNSIGASDTNFKSLGGKWEGNNVNWQRISGTMAGASTKGNIYNFYYASDIDGYGGPLGASTSASDFARFYNDATPYTDTHDQRMSVVIRNYAGTPGSIKAWMAGGTVVDRSGAEVDFGATYGYTYKFNSLDNLAVVQLTEWVYAEANQSVTVSCALNKDSQGATWEVLPKFELFVDGADPFDGGAVLDSFQMTDSLNTSEYDTITATHTARRKYGVRISGRRTSSGNFWAGWTIQVGSGSSERVLAF